jgi:hypothetical protein
MPSRLSIKEKLGGQMQMKCFAGIMLFIYLFMLLLPRAWYIKEI